jgi:lipopolysaccharide export system permease protein
VAAVGVTLFMVAFNDQILPRANHRLRTLQGDIAQKKPTFGLREQVINEVSPGKLYLRAGHLSQTSNKMREITIYDLGDATRHRTVYADSGNMVMSPNHADLQLTLYSGQVQDVPTATPDQLQRVYFDAELIRVKGVGNDFQKTRSDNFKGEREMSVCEMEKNAVVAHRSLVAARKEFRSKLAEAKRKKIKLSSDVLTTKTRDPITVGLGTAYCSLLKQIGVKSLGAQTLETLRPKKSTLVGKAKIVGAAQSPTVAHAIITPNGTGVESSNSAIPAEIDGLRLRLLDARTTENGYEVEIQKKFALAAACFVFILLGAPIALRFPRGGVGLTIGVSLIVFGLYYVGLIGGESLARRDIVPPFISMWGANLIFTALALYLMALLVNRGPRPRLIAALVATCAAAGFTQGRGLMLVLPALFALAVALWRAHAPPDPRRRRALLGAVAGGFAVAGGAIALFATRGSVGGLGGFGSYLWQFYLPALPGMSDPAGPHWTVQQVWMDRFFASYVQFEVFLPTDFVGVLRDAAWLGLALCAAGVVRHRDAIWARRELVAVLVFALVGAVYFLHGAAFHSLVTDPLDPVITGRYVLGFLPLMGIGIALAVTALSRRLGAGVGAAVLAGGALLQLSALGLVVARFYA